MLRRWMQPRSAAALVAVTFMAAAALLCAGPARAQPRVVVSIKPIHSLVAAVMDGVGQPALLLRGAGSPHAYSLRPSDARALRAAEVVVWVGPGLETFLVKPLASLAPRARVVTLLQAPAVRLLPARTGGAWGGHDHDDRVGPDRPNDPGADDRGTPHAAQGGPELTPNPHIWLDPRNAQALARAIAGALSDTDPAHAIAYRANAARLVERLHALEADLAARLRPVQARPFVVFHDAYPYFESRFGLNAVGAITVSSGQPPGARRVRALREQVRALGAVCVFSEPQFEPRLVQTLVQGTPARTHVLDPLGADLPEGPRHYFALLTHLANGMVQCLGGAGAAQR